MARRRSNKELPGYRGFKGSDNTSNEVSLPDGAVREAENIDFANDGRVGRRQGAVQVHAGTAVHSLFGWNDGAVFAEGANLYFQPGDPQSGLPSALVTGLMQREPISYAEIGVDLFWSNGQVSGIIEEDETTKEWGLETPDGAPTLTANATGNYVAGRYQVTVTFLDADGRESGAPPPALIELDDNQGLDLTNIPQSGDTNVTEIAVYVSDPDGEVLFHHSDVPDGTASITLYKAIKGEQCQTLFMDRMPAGHIVRYFNGRLLSVADNVIYHSQPLRYGLCKVHEDYIRSAKRVTLCEPIADGDGSGYFYADDKRTYYVDGSDPETSQIRVVYPVGAVEGSSTTAPGTDLGLEYSGHVPVWLANNGRPVAGVPGGQILVLNDKYVADEFERGAAFYRESETYKQVIIAVTGKGAASSLSANDTAVASVHFAPNAVAEEMTISDAVADTVVWGSTPLVVDLLAYWDLKELSGTRFESSGNGYHLTDVNSVSNRPGVDGVQIAAECLQASSQYLNMASVAAMQLTGDRTWLGWFRPYTVSGNHGLLSKWTGGDEWVLYQAGNSVRLLVADSVAGSSEAVWTGLLVSTWNFVVASYTAADKKTRISVNGSAGTPGPALTNAPRTDVSPIRIGAFEASYFDGRGSAFAIYDRILTAAEQTWLYNTATAARFYDDLNGFTP